MQSIMIYFLIYFLTNSSAVSWIEFCVYLLYSTGSQYAKCARILQSALRIFQHMGGILRMGFSSIP